MTAVEKQELAGFLDITDDFLSSGYRSAEREYRFEDDAVLAGKAAQAAAQANSAQSNGVQVGGAQSGEQSNGAYGSGAQSGGDSIEKIAAEVRVCRNCPLAEKRTNAVPGEGVMQPLVMVIGEGPGADEDAQGRPFVGRAGQLLDKMLNAINLSRKTNCFIANVVKCRPPQNREPYPEETALCAHFLERQIAMLKPKFILCVGNVSARALLKTNERVGHLRGKFTDYAAGDLTIPLFVTYHPSALLHSDTYKRPAWEDLKLLRAKIEELYGGS